LPPHWGSESKDNTSPGSRTPNQEFNGSQAEFEQRLQSDGYTKGTAKDGTIQYTKGNETITIYPKATSTGQPSAQVKVNDTVIVKIRFQ